MKDIISRAGDKLLINFGATGNSKRVFCAELSTGFSFDLSEDRQKLELVQLATGTRATVEAFSNEQLASTALARVQLAVTRYIWCSRVRRVLRTIAIAVACLLGAMLVLSLNAAATGVLATQTVGAVASLSPATTDDNAPTSPEVVAAVPSAPPSTELAQALASGHSSGKYSVQLTEGSGGTLYVFSDPSCMHCRRLERQVEQLQGQASVVIFPVTAFGGDKSEQALSGVFCSQGADRVKAWKGAISDASGDVAECALDAAALWSNNEFFNAMGFAGTPSIVNGRGEVFPTTRAATAANLISWAARP